MQNDIAAVNTIDTKHFAAGGSANSPATTPFGRDLPPHKSSKFSPKRDITASEGIGVSTFGANESAFRANAQLTAPEREDEFLLKVAETKFDDSMDVNAAPEGSPYVVVHDT